MSSFRFKYRQYALRFCQENKFNSNKEFKILVVLAFLFEVQLVKCKLPLCLSKLKNRAELTSIKNIFVESVHEIPFIFVQAFS